VTWASVKALLSSSSAIYAFFDSAPAQAAFRTDSVMLGLLGSVAAQSVQYDATGFKGFAAGDYVLRVSLAHSAVA